MDTEFKLGGEKAENWHKKKDWVFEFTRHDQTYQFLYAVITSNTNTHNSFVPHISDTACCDKSINLFTLAGKKRNNK